MLPFSVLRVWLLGIFGWALLGLGIYLGYEAYQEFQRTADPPQVAADADDSSKSLPEDAALQNADLNPREEWRKWALLAGCIACLGISFGGFWPVSLLLGNSTGKEPEEVAPLQTLTIDRPHNSRLSIEVYGDPTAPTLLLTHGWSLDATAWNYVKGSLARRYRVVTWDLPGLGKSKGPDNGDYSLQRMAADLAAVIAATDNRGPLVLVGHSIGGMILQTFCRTQAEHLSNVQGLVFLHTTYTNPLRTNLLSSLTTALEWPLIVPLQYLTIGLAPLAWLSNWQSYLNGSLHISTRISSFAGAQTRRQLDHGARLAAGAWPGVLARGNLAMLSFNEEATLPTIGLPSLVIGGEHDRMTLPDASGYIAKLLPDDRPFAVNAGHLGHWELGDQVAEAISEFAGAVVQQQSPARHARSIVT